MLASGTIDIMLSCDNIDIAFESMHLSTTLTGYGGHMTSG